MWNAETLPYMQLDDFRWAGESRSLHRLTLLMEDTEYRHSSSFFKCFSSYGWIYLKLLRLMKCFIKRTFIQWLSNFFILVAFSPYYWDMLVSVLFTHKQFILLMKLWIKTSFWLLNRVQINSVLIYSSTKSYQIVIWPDAKQFSEVAEGHRSVCFKAEVREMMSWGEVTAFTRFTGRNKAEKVHQYIKMFQVRLIISNVSL